MEELEEGPKTLAEHLRAELRSIQTTVTMDEVRAFNELIYTASQTGTLGFDISSDDTRKVIGLVKLATKYSLGVPAHLKM